ncbi:hypothetical protein CRG98_030486 [Punica granatum]|uniref:Uncharacterized protein n=1 Tax=Punica granatum TaxID=22663 RepID=A0A2I0IZN1_PUNGR|nr:hypothetical protein CRG98_030486 [Punica granatum]
MGILWRSGQLLLRLHWRRTQEIILRMTLLCQNLKTLWWRMGLRLHIISKIYLLLGGTRRLRMWKLWRLRPLRRSLLCSLPGMMPNVELRGAGNMKFTHELKELIRVHNPDIIIIAEPRISGARADTVCEKAYDRLSWKFIADTLALVGIPNKLRDDLLLFAEASEGQMVELYSVLDQFCSASCQVDVINQSKSCGGLGLRQVYDFNTALLGKIGWGLHTRPSDLWIALGISLVLPGSSIILPAFELLPHTLLLFWQDRMI